MVEIIVAQSAAQMQHVRELSRGYVAWLVNWIDRWAFTIPKCLEPMVTRAVKPICLANTARPMAVCCSLLSIRDRPAALHYESSMRESAMRMLFVDPEFQGLGVGRALVVGLLDEGRKMGYTSMCLDTSRHMVSAHRLPRLASGRLGRTTTDKTASRTSRTFMERRLV